MRTLKFSLVSFGLGALAVLALPPWHYVLVVLFSFSGLMSLLDRMETKKQAFILGYAFGAGFYGVGLSWVSEALRIENMGFSHLAFFPPLGFAIWGGMFPAAAALAAYKAPKGMRRLLAFSAAWLVFDWVRSWLFTGFPWNMLATMFSDTPVFLQTASIFGAYGLGFVITFTATLPYYISENRRDMKKAFFAALGMVLMLSGLWGFGEHRLKNAPTDTIRGVRLRLVQANVPQGQKWNDKRSEEYLMKHVHLSRKDAEGITHVIWPETATPFLLAQDEFARSMAITAVKDGALLITGGLRAEPNPDKKDYPPVNVYNSILVFNDIGELLGSYDKSHLVPFGEYAPFRSVLPFMKKLTPGAFDFETGGGVETKDIPRTLPAGMLVCYEVIFPGRVVDRTRRPYWLLNVTNDGWYGLSAGPHQHFATTVMRAVEEGIPIVRSANTGISGVIDAYGRVVAKLPLGEQGFVDSGLPRRTPEPPLYARTGNLLPLNVSLAIILVCLVPIKRRKKP